jgi:hypothetical protein
MYTLGCHGRMTHTRRSAVIIVRLATRTGRNVAVIVVTIRRSCKILTTKVKQNKIIRLLKQQKREMTIAGRFLTFERHLIVIGRPSIFEVDVCCCVC